MQPRLRRTLTAVALTAAVAIATLGGVLLYTRSLAEQRAVASLDHTASRAAYDAFRVLWAAEGALAEVDYVARRFGCGGELIRSFAAIAVAQPWLRTMVYLTAGSQLACTSFGLIDPPVAVELMAGPLIRPSDTRLVFTPPLSAAFAPGNSVIIANPVTSGARAGDWVAVLVPAQEFLGPIRTDGMLPAAWVQFAIDGTLISTHGQPRDGAQMTIVRRHAVGAFEAEVTAGLLRVDALAGWRAAAKSNGVPAALLALLAVGVVGLLMWRRTSFTSELRDAVANGEIEVFYQPVIDLARHRCVGAESLVRWRHRERGLISPELFVALAEETGDIVPITRFLMKQVMTEIGPRLRHDRDLHVAINLAPIHFRNQEVVADVRDLMAGSGVLPSQILFEITERGLVNEKECRRVIDGLKAAGHEIAVDDFGTGYSSLAYIERFQLDYLKIDQAFVRAIGTGAATAGLADVIIDMATALSLKIIAEGVETAEQAHHLIARGVQEAQGWLYAKAMPAQEFLAFVDRFNAGDRQIPPTAQAEGGPADSANRAAAQPVLDGHRAF